ncbi:CHY zinc finger protein [Brevibacterium aurantiacum]|uniref:CHY-type domain-containing protein n=1 Tax=Brevibacterium aurantiacum TaxID=273384 RepID=A0A2A3YX87_BREAU|nr:CHY zinc finger protein [Brevibacterium aurantiacum]PCC43893.1 hypothetical protein CIK65_04680 [Brevibacterium aurantiacum]PCC48157.1 hypothetical protein CIK64_00160 [Brevibacterium aurantiacum]
MTSSPQVSDKTVDNYTRCEHYSTGLDIIAIRFYCCDRYYPCRLCHAECAGHPAQQWPREEWNRFAILCGACETELSIETYLRADACPECATGFNPGCKAHSS